ncbi:unnamed protein product [Arabidopsis halleri]
MPSEIRRNGAVAATSSKLLGRFAMGRGGKRDVNSFIVEGSFTAVVCSMDLRSDKETELSRGKASLHERETGRDGGGGRRGVKARE